MFKGLIKLAAYYDKIGNYEQSDKLTSGLQKIAENFTDLARNKVKNVEEILGDTNTGIYDEKPTNHIIDRDFHQPLRKEFQPLYEEHLFNQSKKGQGEKREPFELDLSTIDKRRDIRNLLENASSDDTFAEEAITSMDAMDRREGDPRVNPEKVYNYGQHLIKGPLLRTLVEGPSRGEYVDDYIQPGKQRISHFFLDAEMAKQFAQNAAETLAWALSGKKQNARFLAEILGSGGNGKPGKTLNDIVVSTLLEECIAPGSGMLSALKAMKKTEEGKDPGVRGVYPDEQYRAFNTSWMKQLTPGTTENEKAKPQLVAQIANLIEKNLKEFKKYGIDATEAAQMALADTVRGGLEGRGGMITPNYIDTPEFKQISGNSGKADSVFPQYNRIQKDLLPPAVAKHAEDFGLPQDLGSYIGELGKPHTGDFDAGKLILPRNLPKPEKYASHVALVKYAQILDEIGDYKDADRITGLLVKYANAKDSVLDSLENDFQNDVEGGDEEVTNLGPTKKPRFFPEDIVPQDLDVNPSNRNLLNFYESQGENGPAPWLLGENGTMGGSRANDKPGERWFGTNRHVTINRAPTHLDAPQHLRQLYMPNDAYQELQEENQPFISKAMPEDGPKSRSTFEVDEYLKKFKEAPTEGDTDKKRIVFDRKLMGLVGEVLGDYSKLQGKEPRQNNIPEGERPIQAFSADELMKLSIRGLDGQEKQERIQEITSRISDKIDALREDGVINIDELEKSNPKILRALVKAMLLAEARRSYYPALMSGLSMASPEEGFSKNYYPDLRRVEENLPKLDTLPRL